VGSHTTHPDRRSSIAMNMTFGLGAGALHRRLAPG
jgi:hypothetical protein